LCGKEKKNGEKKFPPFFNPFSNIEKSGKKSQNSRAKKTKGKKTLKIPFKPGKKKPKVLTPKMGRK